MTTMSGSASARSRAARFGGPADHFIFVRRFLNMRSPTIKRPVAMPIRTCKCHSSGSFDLGHSVNQFQPGAHCALCVVFMGLPIAEIGEYAVAQVSGDEARRSGR